MFVNVYDIWVYYCLGRFVSLIHCCVNRYLLGSQICNIFVHCADICICIDCVLALFPYAIFCCYRLKAISDLLPELFIHAYQNEKGITFVSINRTTGKKSNVFLARNFKNYQKAKTFLFHGHSKI